MRKFNNELSVIISKLETQGNVSFMPKATEEQISEFETQNSITLPTKYKEWLLFSDGGDCFLPAGIQLYGVAHKPMIDLNDDDRPNDNYIVIGTLASGDPIICEKNYEHISIYNHEIGKIEENESFTDFFEFLSNLEKILHR